MAAKQRPVHNRLPASTDWSTMRATTEMKGMQFDNKSICLVSHSYIKSNWYPSCGAEAAHRTAATETCPKPMMGDIGTTTTATGSTHAGAYKLIGSK